MVYDCLMKVENVINRGKVSGGSGKKARGGEKDKELLQKNS